MTCPADEDREMARSEINTEVRELLQEIVTSTSIDSPCGPGWTLAVLLNMSDPSQQCPEPWTETVSGYPSSDKRVCYRSESSGASCDSVTYTISGEGYDQVCGRIIGYQYYNPHGFFPYHSSGYSIDTYYVDGLSVTHGEPPRMHIWTFAAGFSERDDAGSCPCGSPTAVADIPPYVGNNFFCETGFTSTVSSALATDDPLWDGEGCGTDHECECTLNSPPWFTAQLPTSTTDDIEVRNCAYQGTTKNVGIELIELYVK